MNIFSAAFSLPFVMIKMVWQIGQALLQLVLLAWELAKLSVVSVKLAWRLLRNTYYRWF